MQQNTMLNLAIIIVSWFIFYFIAELLNLRERGWEVKPLYALVRSKRLNNFIEWLAKLNPKFWRIFGNIAVVASVGQVIFLSSLLFRNMLNFIFRPEQASPVQPLIPGVTIGGGSLPWFFASTGLIILIHELSHGIQCAVEGVQIKNSALLIAVITFGGAIEPDEESIENAGMMSKLRIFASGSLANLLTGLILVPVFVLFGRILPQFVLIFLNWVYFISINLAMVNMLPVGPLDGSQMWRTWTERFNNAPMMRKILNYGFITLIGTNIILSFAQFGLIPL